MRCGAENHGHFNYMPERQLWQHLTIAGGGLWQACYRNHTSINRCAWHFMGPTPERCSCLAVFMSRSLTCACHFPMTPQSPQALLSFLFLRMAIFLTTPCWCTITKMLCRRLWVPRDWQDGRRKLHSQACICDAESWLTDAHSEGSSCQHGDGTVSHRILWDACIFADVPHSFLPFH